MGRNRNVKWYCENCGVEGVVRASITNPYAVGYEIYAEHNKVSPRCVTEPRFMRIRPDKLPSVR